jgi:hypothetical protein
VQQQLLKHASAPPRSYDQRLELAEVASPRRLTCQCSHKAGNIESFPLQICRVVLFLLQQRRGAAGHGELQRARGLFGMHARATVNPVFLAELSHGVS